MPESFNNISNGQTWWDWCLHIICFWGGRPHSYAEEVARSPTNVGPRTNSSRRSNQKLSPTTTCMLGCPSSPCHLLEIALLTASWPGPTKQETTFWADDWPKETLPLITPWQQTRNTNTINSEELCSCEWTWLFKLAFCARDVKKFVFFIHSHIYYAPDFLWLLTYFYVPCKTGVGMVFQTYWSFSFV